MDLNVYVVTDNCARQPSYDELFAPHLYDGLKDKVLPDLVVFCLQEVAPISYSFFNTAKLRPWISAFDKTVRRASKELNAPPLQLIHWHNVGMTAIAVFAKQEIVERIIRIDTAGVGVGLWEMGNKGAVGTRLWFSEETYPITFVSAHLAPHEADWQRRNEDWKSICERLVFTETNKKHHEDGEDTGPLLEFTPPDVAKEADLFTPSAPFFFAGDLNYRTSDIKPEKDTYSSWSTPTVKAKPNDAFLSLLEHDQLNRERKAGRVFQSLTEAKIEFIPTYKYVKGGQKDSSNTRSEQPAFEKHRTPSWCDRILYLENAAIDIQSYTALHVQQFSDHRPVALSAKVKLSSTGQVSNPYKVDPAWKSRRRTARMLEIIVGIVAYHTTTQKGLTITLVAVAVIAILSLLQYLR